MTTVKLNQEVRTSDGDIATLNQLLADGRGYAQSSIMESRQSESGYVRVYEIVDRGTEQRDDQGRLVSWNSWRIGKTAYESLMKRGLAPKIEERPWEREAREKKARQKNALQWPTRW